jgi:hypothetical protein
LAHGFPVSSSASRTTLGDAAGARSQAYSLAALVTIIVTGRGLTVALARVKQDLLHDLASYGLADSLGRNHLFPTLPRSGRLFEVTP